VTVRTKTKPSVRGDVVVFGEAIWDFFPRVPGEPLATRALEVRHPGGAPANVARTLSRLGVATCLVTAVGDDALGAGMIAELAHSGVGVADIVRLPARTAVTFVEVSKKGDRSFLFYRHPSADMQFEESMLPLHSFDARWLHVGSSTLVREPSRTATRTILARARSSGARISVDVNARRHLWPSTDALRTMLLPIIDRADVVKVSEEDLDALGLPADEDGGRALHARRADRVTLLTLAERGAVAFWGEREARVKAPRARAIDVTGAGDAFMAGALASLIRDDPFTADERQRDAILTRALTLGCKLGTRAITRLGATTALRSIPKLRPLAAPARKRHR
jgi:fructokinase